MKVSNHCSGVAQNLFLLLSSQSLPDLNKFSAEQWDQAMVSNGTDSSSTEKESISYHAPVFKSMSGHSVRI